MPRGIRDIPPEAGDKLRARVAKDRDFYFRLRNRLVDRAHIRDDDTQKAIVWSGRVWEALYTLDWALHSAGTEKGVDPGEAGEDVTRWNGSDI